MMVLVFMYNTHNYDKNVAQANCGRMKKINPYLKHNYDKLKPLAKEQEIYNLKQHLRVVQQRSYRTKKIMLAVIEGFLKGCLLGLLGGHGNLGYISKSAMTWAIVPILIINMNSSLRSIIGLN